MTEAYAIKGPDGQLYLTTGLGMSQEDAWYNFVESERHPDDNISDQERNERIAEAKLSANTCVPVTVSEKGEAEALLKYLLDRYDSGQSWDWADWNRVRDYLSRGQG